MRKAYRKRSSVYTRTILNLSPLDREILQRIKSVYMKRLGFELSHSIVFALALEALLEELQRGACRTHRDARLSKAGVACQGT
jgi:hypothetical protein